MAWKGAINRAQIKVRLILRLISDQRVEELTFGSAADPVVLPDEGDEIEAPAITEAAAPPNPNRARNPNVSPPSHVYSDRELVAKLEGVRSSGSFLPAHGSQLSPWGAPPPRGAASPLPDEFAAMTGLLHDGRSSTPRPPQTRRKVRGAAVQQASLPPQSEQQRSVHRLASPSAAVRPLSGCGRLPTERRQQQLNKYAPGVVRQVCTKIMISGGDSGPDWAAHTDSKVVLGTPLETPRTNQRTRQMQQMQMRQIQMRQMESQSQMHAQSVRAVAATMPGPPATLHGVPWSALAGSTLAPQEQLLKMKLSRLRKLAEWSGVPSSEISSAVDSAAPKDELVRLLAKQEAQSMRKQEAQSVRAKQEAQAPHANDTPRWKVGPHNMDYPPTRWP